MEQKNGYELAKQWFDFVFETDENITPMHTALYFWIVELNNRLKWCDVFGLPTDYSMRAIGTKTYKSYKKALKDLIRWGFIRLIAKSYNQYTCNQIALVKKSKALSKALPPYKTIIKTCKKEILEKNFQEPRESRKITHDTI
jgi:CRISPR/Cas system-associated protein endoribonuclease Cas2